MNKYFSRLLDAYLMGIIIIFVSLLIFFLTFQIPCTADLLTTSGMQLALMVQPLAIPYPSEETVQVMHDYLYVKLSVLLSSSSSSSSIGTSFN